MISKVQNSKETWQLGECDCAMDPEPEKIVCYKGTAKFSVLRALLIERPAVMKVFYIYVFQYIHTGLLSVWNVTSIIEKLNI